MLSHPVFPRKKPQPGGGVKFPGGRHRQQGGFTLFELMIAIVIVGNLAALAIPTYEVYIARSQLTEGLNFIKAAKTALVEYHYENSRFPTSLSTAYDTAGHKERIMGQYTQYIDGWGWAGWPDYFMIFVEVNYDNVIKPLKSVRWMGVETKDGGKSWSCGSWFEEYKKYFPSSCKTIF